MQSILVFCFVLFSWNVQHIIALFYSSFHTSFKVTLLCGPSPSVPMAVNTLCQHFKCYYTTQFTCLSPSKVCKHSGFILVRSEPNTLPCCNTCSVNVYSVNNFVTNSHHKCEGIVYFFKKFSPIINCRSSHQHKISQRYRDWDSQGLKEPEHQECC